MSVPYELELPLASLSSLVLGYSVLKLSTFPVLHSRVGYWPYQQTFVYPWTNTSVLQTLLIYGCKSLLTLSTGTVSATLHFLLNLRMGLIS